MTQQALELALLPKGAFLLEFVDTDEHFDEASSQAQRDLLRRYHQDPENWLLLLGFRDRTLRFSPSLE